jgi:hypothetical protein
MRFSVDQQGSISPWVPTCQCGNKFQASEVCQEQCEDCHEKTIAERDVIAAVEPAQIADEPNVTVNMDPAKQDADKAASVTVQSVAESSSTPVSDRSTQPIFADVFSALRGPGKVDPSGKDDSSLKSEDTRLSRDRRLTINSDQAFENTSTSVAASQMRNALNNLADTVTDPVQKKLFETEMDNFFALFRRYLNDKAKGNTL